MGIKFPERETFYENQFSSKILRTLYLRSGGGSGKDGGHGEGSGERI
jgi:hypothetical protein